MYTTISTDAPGVTLINVFTVAPDRQDDLVAALDRATAEVFVDLPGFRSANIHASLDGVRVVNYAQWASEEGFTAMLKRDDVQAHMKEIMTIADAYEPRLFAVRAVHNVEHRP
jgi:heme-degrading monooxygenase HmoA